MKVRSNAEQVLRENYSRSSKTETFPAWVVLEKDSDPGFFRWFFNDGTLGDFEQGMTVEHYQVWNEFLQSIQ